MHFASTGYLNINHTDQARGLRRVIIPHAWSNWNKKLKSSYEVMAMQTEK